MNMAVVDEITKGQILDELAKAGVPEPLLWDAMLAVQKIIGTKRD